MGTLTFFWKVLIGAFTVAIKYYSATVKVTYVASTALLSLIASDYTVSLGKNTDSDIMSHIPLPLVIVAVSIVVLAVFCLAMSFAMVPRIQILDKADTLYLVDEHCAIRIQNSSWGKPVKGCTAELVELTPLPPSIRKDLHTALHCSGILFDIQTVDVGPRGERIFDVFALDNGRLKIAGFQEGVRAVIPMVDYDVTVKVYGEDVPPTVYKFKFVVGELPPPPAPRARISLRELYDRKHGKRRN